MEAEDTRLKLIGLFVVVDDLQAQQDVAVDAAVRELMRAGADGGTGLTSRTAEECVRDWVTDFAYGREGRVQGRVDAMLERLGLAALATPTPGEQP